MEELEKLDYPKPNAELIYGIFDAFAQTHPWVGHDAVRPKGVAREIYERAQDLRGYVVDLGLERSEGVVLRYLTDVYKALVQTVPNWGYSAEVEDMIEFFREVVRGVDSSLLDEWEKLRDPSYVPSPDEPEPEVISREVIADERAFTVLLRNALFRIVRALSARDHAGAARELSTNDDEEPWTEDRLATAMAPFWEEHQALRTDPRARARPTEHILVDKEPASWRVRQTLLDAEGDHDFHLDLRVDLERSAAEDRPVMVLQHLGR